MDNMRMVKSTLRAYMGLRWFAHAYLPACIATTFCLYYRARTCHALYTGCHPTLPLGSLCLATTLYGSGWLAPLRYGSERYGGVLLPGSVAFATLLVLYPRTIPHL